MIVHAARHRSTAGAHRLALRQLGVDTYQEPVIYMRSDCHVCRAEGFAAHSRVRLSLGAKRLIATLNVIHGDLLLHGEAALSEAAWIALGAAEGDAIELAHAEPAVSDRALRAKVYGGKLSSADAEAIVRDVVLVCTLNAPDDKSLALLFAARTARALGARRVGLVAPYLAYMRQDKRFHPGEAVTSTDYGALLSGAFDWLVTVDPHLHRRSSLSEAYAIPNRVIHAAPLVAEWIGSHVSNALVVGPDAESEQWVTSVAEAASAAHVTMEKTRRGDRDVEISIPHLARWRGRIPVLVDDVISSGRAMAVASRRLREEGFAAPYCVGVHGLFAGAAYEQLLAAGAKAVVTTNTVCHASNAIDVSGVLLQAVKALLKEKER